MKSTIAKYVLMIIAFALILLLLSCGSAYNLRQAKKHLKKAEMKGAKIEIDTVYKELVTERTVTDTVVKFISVNKVFTDTVTIETTKWKTKTKIDTIDHEVRIFQQVECKPDTIRVPVRIENNIIAGYSNGHLIVGGLLLVLLIVLICKLLK